jgi:hypothetical protein
MKKTEYVEGPKAGKKCERTMTALFRPPKTVAIKQPKPKKGKD